MTEANYCRGTTTTPPRKVARAGNGEREKIELNYFQKII